MIEIDTTNQHGIIEFGSNVLGDDYHGRATAIGVYNDGEPIASIMFTDYHHDAKWCEITIAATSPKWMTRKVLAFIGDHVFNKLHCDLLQSTVAEYPRNKSKKLRDFNTRSGFKLEGKMRGRFPEYEGNPNGAYVFSMTKEECQWLKEKETSNEQRLSTNAPAPA